MQEGKTYLDTARLANRLGISYYMADKMMKLKGFPSFPLDRDGRTSHIHYMVELSDLENWIEKSKKTPKI